MRNSIVIPAASGLFGLVALIGLAAMPAHALEPKSPPASPCDQCLARCPPGQNTCRLHCNAYECAGKPPQRGILQIPGGAAAPGKSVPLQKLQVAPAQ